MRTPTGEYRIDFYNQYGERIKGSSLPAKSFIEAKKKGEEALSITKVSFTINRCLFNSLDRKD